jgi:hypothetical protein
MGRRACGTELCSCRILVFQDTAVDAGACVRCFVVGVVSSLGNC